MTVRLALLGASALSMFAAPAWAQTLAEEESAPDAIVVTAQLREQDPIEVPIALTAIDGDLASRLGLNEFEQLSRFVPGFFVQNQSPNNPGFVMRGITSDSGTAYNEPRVSVFQDGVSISKSRGSYVELFDVERVEVAKGPQSTLYGRGALIGAVNIVQAKADPSGYSAYGRAQYGNFDQYLLEAMGNVPLSDQVAIRLASRIRSRDGYTENELGGADFNAVDTMAVRASLRIDTGPFTLDVIGNYQHDKPDGTGFKSIAYDPTDPVTGTVIGNRGRTSGAALAPSAGFEGGRDLGLDREVGGITGIARVDLGGGFALTSITAYREFDALEIFDADGISLPVLTAAEDAHGEQTSQELRIAYDDGIVSAFVGGSYFHEDGYQRTPAVFDERLALARLTNTLAGPPALGRPVTSPAPFAVFANTAFTGALIQGAAASFGIPIPAAQAQAIAANLRRAQLETSTNSSETDAIDLFGDVTVKIGDALELGAGLRWTHDDKSTAYTASVIGGRSVLGGLIGALGQPAAIRAQILGGLALPGAGTSLAIPLPIFGLGLQPTAGNGNTDTADLDGDAGGFSWRATARYAATPDVNLYATYARGRRPAILAASPPSTPFGATTFTELPPETVDSFEVGAKTALMDRTLFVDGSIFYYDYSNFQTVVQQGTTFVPTNAGKAESYGFEGQARWLPTEGVTLFATYGYNHSRFQSGAYSGNRFRLSPDHSAAFGAVTEFDLGPGKVTFSPSVTWQSRVYFDDDNDRSNLQQPPAALVADNIQDETQGGYALVNARLGYQSPDGRWQLEGFVENLFEQDYISDAGNTGDALGLPTFIAGAPRFYGVSLTIREGRR